MTYPATAEFKRIISCRKFDCFALKGTRSLVALDSATIVSYCGLKLRIVCLYVFIGLLKADSPGGVVALTINAAANAGAYQCTGKKRD